MLLGLQTSAKSVLCALLVNLVTTISAKFCVPAAVLSTLTIATNTVQAAPAPGSAPHVGLPGDDPAEPDEGSGALMMMNGSTEARLGKSLCCSRAWRSPAHRAWCPR